jgi:hypothetical protein
MQHQKPPHDLQSPMSAEKLTTLNNCEVYEKYFVVFELSRT